MTNTNTLTFGDNTTGPDPRCPYCGRAVLGTFVQGNEGRYHPECTQPPMPCVPVVPNPWLVPPWWVPLPYNGGPTITCKSEASK